MPWGSNGAGELTHLNAVNTSGLAVGSHRGAGDDGTVVAAVLEPNRA